MSTLKDIARIVALRNHMQQQQSEDFINLIIGVIKNGLADDGIVKIKGLGTFKLQKVRERESIDVNTGKRVTIGSHDRISFTPDNSMKDSVNKPFSHFETVVLNDGVTFDDTAEENRDELNENLDPQEVVIPTTEEKQVLEATLSEEQKEQKEEKEEDNIIEKAPDNIIEKVSDTIIETDDEVTSSNESPNNMSKESYSDKPFLDDEKYDNPENGKTGFSFLRTLGIIAACFVIFVVGVITGRLTTDSGLWPKWPPSFAKAIPTEVEEITDSVVLDSLDSIARINSEVMTKTYKKQKPVEEKKEEATEAKKKEDTKPTAPEKKPKADAEATPKLDEKKTTDKATLPKLNKSQQDEYNKDPRVRTGAYVITGVSQTVKVKENQTLESISRTYLGPGMECYVEAINGGIKEVAPGQTIKIPELIHKKKLNKK